MIQDNLVPLGKERDFLEALESAVLNGNEKAAKKVQGVMAHFMKAPDVRAKEAREAQLAEVARIKASSSTTDVPIVISDTVSSVHQETPEYDNQWELFYRQVPVAPGHGFFKIVTMNSNVGFAIQEEGEEIAVGKFVGKAIHVPIITVAAGIGWTLQMIQDRELATMYDMALDFRDKYNKDKADRHYAIPVAAGTATGTTSAQSGATVLEQMINTLNKGYTDLIEPIKDKFPGISGAQVFIVCREIHRANVMRAFRESGGFNQVPLVEYPITPIFTWNDEMPTNVNHAVMILPGRKLQRAVKMEKQSWTKWMQENLAWVQHDAARYGAGIGEPGQCRLIELPT